jgi:hypothetical protein
MRGTNFDVALVSWPKGNKPTLTVTNTGNTLLVTSATETVTLSEDSAIIDAGDRYTVANFTDSPLSYRAITLSGLGEESYTNHGAVTVTTARGGTLIGNQP